MQDLFLKTLSRAQKYKDDSEYSSTEIKMTSIAKNVKQSSKDLPVIIGFLNKNNENYNRMKGFIANNSIKLLEYADSKMDEEGIFKIDSNIAKNWKGEKNANMKIFSKQSPQAVKAHFDSQYQRVLALSDNIAKPANLIFQNTEFLSYKNNTSISDWIMIENQIKEFQNKAANNQIEAIEKYMTSELSDIDYKKCFKKKTKSVDSDNFFAKTLNDMQTAVIKRCNEINYEKAIENYNEIATFFNTNMAGRFPFSMQNTRQDIDLNAINKFINLYEEKQDKIRETLEELTKDSKILFEDAKQFLIQTADVYEFLKEGLKKDGSLGYKIKSEYNAYSNKAEGNESLIDFTVTSGPISVPQSAEKKEFEWRYGDNFSINVDYIRDGPWIPIESDNYPNVAAISNKANIRSPGPWSFIRMANSFRATTQDLGGIENPNGDILKFDIQSASSREIGQFLKTKFFMKFSIMKKGKDGKEQEMKIPQFPQSAPILSDVLYSMIDRAVESNM